MSGSSPPNIGKGRRIHNRTWRSEDTGFTRIHFSLNSLHQGSRSATRGVHRVHHAFSSLCRTGNPTRWRHKMVHLLPIFAYLLATIAYGYKCTLLLANKEMKDFACELFF